MSLFSDTKLLSILKSLSAWERNRFTKFVQSPYFNTDLKLVSLLEKVLEEMDSGEVSREELDQFLHPEEDFQYDRITNYLSYLTRHLENFLAYERIRKDPFQLRYQTLCEARERGIGKLFRQIDREFERRETSKKSWNAEDYYQGHLIENERNAFFLSQERRKNDESFTRNISHIEHFYFLAMLKAVCQLINLRNVIQSQTEEADLLEFLKTIQNRHQQFASDPLIYIYYRVLMTLIESEEPQHYFQLKNDLENLKEAIIPLERKTIYQYGLNYCIKKANSGNTEFLEELFELYQAMINEKLIFQDGYILHHDVKNIVSLGVRLKKFTWTESFMEEVRESITPEHRNNSLNYNLAYLFHGKGELRKALRLLREVELQDVYYALGARTLLMKIYYELNEQEGLDSLIHSFRNYLSRNKIVSVYQRKIHLNLIKFVGRLNKIRVKKMILSPYVFKEQTQRLHKRIITTKEITNIGWLLGELEKLANN
ncbi:MAG: hypothetical protein R3B93_18480 [Bacteroidia bacterium]